MADRIDWMKIKSMLGVSYDAPYFFVLPNAGRQLLHAMVHRLEWEATYREFGYDFGDFDELQAIVADTQTGLMDGVNMHELLAMLELVVEAIQGIKVSLNNTVNCCDNPQNVQTADNGVIIDEGTVPEVYGNEPVTNWNDYKQLVCGASHAWVSGMVDIITRFSEALDNGLLVAGGLAFLLAIMAIVGVLIPIEFGLAFGLFSTLVALLTSEPLDDLILYFQTNEARLANVAYCAGNATDAALDMRAFLENELTDVQWNIVRWFDLESSMAVIYAGVNSAGEALTVSPDSSCDCLPEVGYGFYKPVDSPTILTEPELMAVTVYNFTIIDNDYYADTGGRVTVEGGPNGATVEYSVTLRSSSYVGNLNILTQEPGGSGSVQIALNAQPGQTYSGEVTLSADQQFRGLIGYYGLHMTAFSLIAYGGV